MIILYVWLAIFAAVLLLAAFLFGLFCWVRREVRKAEKQPINPS